jgi:hypothetical protein
MVASVTYFLNQADTLTYTNPIATGSFILGTLFSGSITPYTAWSIGYWGGTGPPPTGVFTNGTDISGIVSNFAVRVYPATVCFKEGTNILCLVDGKEVYQAIETLKEGSLVKTRRSGYKKIEILASGAIQNPGTHQRIPGRLYKCSKAAYPELTEDLYLTGQHSILVDSITEKQKQGILTHLGRIFVTDNKYRLIACVDERAEPWASEGTYTIWHLALENIDPNMNYGIYVNGGLLVETCCLDTLKNKSNLTPI